MTVGAISTLARSSRHAWSLNVALPRSVSYLARRLLQVVPVVFLVLTANFFLLRLAPGDLADVIAGESGAYTTEYVDSLRADFGLDRSVLAQYLSYLNQVAHVDLGWSFRNNMSVLDLILQRLPATALLLVTSLTIAVLLGCVLGTIAAMTRSRALDFVVSLVSAIGFSIPLFWLGLMLIVVFSLKLQWLPSGGMYRIGADLTGFAALREIVTRMVLPVTCLSVYYLAIYARLMRATVSEIRHLDFVRTARAKGASRLRTVFRHILPNALLPMITLTGLQFGTLFSGSITIEAVFGWPGLGQLALTAVTSRDVNLLLGILAVSSVFVLLVNVLTDLSYALFDPRVELSQ